jgi:hypothetical protein
MKCNAMGYEHRRRVFFKEADQERKDRRTVSFIHELLNRFPTLAAVHPRHVKRVLPALIEIDV